MARGLRYLGLALAAIGVSGLLAGEAGWLPAEVAGRPAVALLRAAAVVFASGLALEVLARGWRGLRRGHCARCGARIEWGQTYCLDHLKATVNEARDLHPTGPRRRRV
jgi:hypothetical protein